MNAYVNMLKCNFQRFILNLDNLNFDLIQLKSLNKIFKIKFHQITIENEILIN